MKLRGILALILLALFLSGAGQVSAQKPHHDLRPGNVALLQEVPQCLAVRILRDYDLEILTENSSLGFDGNQVVSVLCNYRISTKASHPAGAGLTSGMAITVNFACPAETEESWKSRTDNRPDAIARTSDSVLLREEREGTGFSGPFTVQERMFLLIDSHTTATIVVNTDYNPGSSDTPVFSAASGRELATDLATLYAPRATDPECGTPPIGGGSSSTSPGGSTISESGEGPWHHIPNSAAVAVAVGTGALIALVGGGILGGLGGSALGMGTTAPAGSAAGQTVPVQPLPTPVAPVQPALTVDLTHDLSSTQDLRGVGSGPPIDAGSTAPAVDYTPVATPAETPQVAAPVEPAPPAVESTTGAAPVEPPVAPVAPVTPPAAEQPPIVQPLVEAAEAVLAVGGAIAQAGSTAKSTGGDSTSGDSDEEPDEDEPDSLCPEAQATLFGLPAINTRQDCPGERPALGPWCAGLDFTSNNEHGVETRLDFEAAVEGTVSYTGGPLNMIEIKRENGNRIQFLHASDIYVSLGQEVGPTTKLGKTGGTGPDGPDQYEVHLHVQAIDEDGMMIDPDCALAAGENKQLRVKGESPYKARLESEKGSTDTNTTHIEVIEPVAETAPTPPAPSLETVIFTQTEPLAPTNPTLTSEALPTDEPASPAEMIDVTEPAQVEEPYEAAPIEPPTPPEAVIQQIEVEPVATDELTPQPEPMSMVEEAPETATLPVAEPTSAAEEVPVAEPAPVTEQLPVPQPDQAQASRAPDAPKQCPNCGQTNPPRARFCSNCGQPFSQGT